MCSVKEGLEGDKNGKENDHRQFAGSLLVVVKVNSTELNEAKNVLK